MKWGGWRVCLTGNWVLGGNERLLLRPPSEWRRERFCLKQIWLKGEEAKVLPNNGCGLYEGFAEWQGKSLSTTGNEEGINLSSKVGSFLSQACFHFLIESRLLPNSLASKRHRPISSSSLLTKVYVRNQAISLLWDSNPPHRQLSNRPWLHRVRMRKQLTKYSLELDTILSNRTPSCVTRTFLSLLSSLRWEMKTISPTRGLWISVRSAINALVPRAAPARERKRMNGRTRGYNAFGCSPFGWIAAFLTGNGPLKSNRPSWSIEDSVHLVARFPGRLSVTRVN